MRWGLFQEGRFLGKVLDEWIDDSQEFVHTKLPQLIVIAIIALLLSRLLRLITHHMTRLAEQRAAGQGRLADVKTMAGVIRATGLAMIVLIAGFMSLDTIGFNLAPLLASAGIAGIAIGLAAQTIVKDMLNGFSDPGRRPVQRGRHRAPGRSERSCGSADAAQHLGARRRRHALRDSQLADHDCGQSERRLQPGHRQCERGFLGRSRCGDGAASTSPWRCASATPSAT